ncbi:MAG: FG-GAP-like repeat-containing protein [Phycisphaerales bacterium JB060]
MGVKLGRGFLALVMVGLLGVVWGVERAVAQPCDGPAFAHQRVYTGSPESDFRPTVFPSADFNGDGTIDFAVPGIGSGPGFHVILTRSDGRLRPGQFLLPGAHVTEIIAADFDGDGVVDLAGTDLFSMHVFKGRGDGGFDLIHSQPNRRQPEGLAAGDFDGDGDLDLAITIFGELSSPGDVLAIARNRGDGVFDAPEHYGTLQDPFAVVAGDFNADGLDDVVVGHAVEHALLLFQGRADGALEAPVSIDLPNSLTSLDMGDADGDGALDLLAAHRGDAGAALLYGDGLGGFETLSLDLGAAHGIARLGRDGGVAEVFYTHNNGLIVLRAVGTRAFEEVHRGPRSWRAANFFAGDLNGDGWSDLAIATLSWFTVELCGPDGSWPSVLASTPAGTSPTDIATGDVNGDGITDLAVADSGNPSGGRAQLMFGDGVGGFEDPIRLYSGRGTNVIMLADLDLDGDLDVLFRSNSGWYVVAGGGDGSFGPVESIPEVPSTLFPRLGELTGDGIPDLVAIDSSASRVLVYPGMGDLSFAAPIVSDSGGHAGPLTLTDATGDGLIDVIVAANIGGTPEGLFTLAGLGDGTVAPPVASPLGVRATGVNSHDIDGDGDMDLAIAHRFDDGVTIALGAGDGTFAFAGFYRDNAHSTPVFADVTGDGHTDVLNANWGWESISVLRGRGDGSFDPAEFYFAGSLIDDLATLDADGDGRTDVVAVQEIPGSVNVLLNACRHSPPCPADLDGDGQLTIFDFLAYQNLFDAGDPIADFDGDGELTIFDFLAFQNAFDAGCG